MDAEKVTELEKFINQCKANPSILSDSSLSFFRDYIENVGGKLPPSAYKSGEHKAKSHVVEDLDEEVEKEDDDDLSDGTAEDEEEPEITESDIEFDDSDVVKPDNDPPQQMGDPSVEVTEESRDASQEAKAQSMETLSEASVYIKMKKPNAAIRDATAALEVVLVPSAYKSGELKVDDDERFHLPLLQPWKERMLAASDQGMLVFLQNLDPEYTSAEVEDIIWNAFREKCNAKVVQRNACSNSHIGQALLIFKSSEAAERVVRKLNDGCLVLSDQRPLVGRPVNVPKQLEKQSKFAGHLVIDKFKPQLQRDKDAVSTSHFAQPCTIEHELAMEWCLLRSRCDIWWKKLHKQHGAELKRLMGGLQSN